MIHVRQYDAATDSQMWDEFARTARNGTLLHQRGYMDYHADRFDDCSLVALDDNRVVALLPANILGDTLCSHQGLTFGGWLLPYRHLDASQMLDVWAAAIAWMGDRGVKHLVYKPAPYIYHAYPADDDLYGLWRAGGQLVVSQVSETVDLAHPIEYNENCKRAVKHATKNGVTISETDDYDCYWQILTDTLLTRHGVQPAHSMSEIKLLASRFPDQIKLWCAFDADGAMVGGTVVYASATCAHAQYIAASPRGRELKALPLLFNHCMEHYRAQGVRYFDFGTCNEDQGRVLNSGLAAQKSGMGGRPIAYNTYSLDL